MSEEFNLEIIERENDVTFEIPAVSFPAYEEYKEKAEAVAEYIGSMEVSADNIKETKLTLAKARKLVDRLDRARIDMKKAILQNYTIFEGQVKEITGIIGEADKELRSKVRELEEIERQEKKKAIRDIWNKRIAPYGEITAVIPDAFERWMKPQYLNKTVSMKMVESEMSTWMVQTLTDIHAARAMGDEYLAAYSRMGDIAKAIEEVHAQRDALETVKAVTTDPVDMVQAKAVFVVYGAKDIALAERLLTENDINYKKGN